MLNGERENYIMCPKFRSRRSLMVDKLDKDSCIVSSISQCILLMQLWYRQLWHVLSFQENIHKYPKTYCEKKKCGLCLRPQNGENFPSCWDFFWGINDSLETKYDTSMPFLKDATCIHSRIGKPFFIAENYNWLVTFISHPLAKTTLDNIVFVIALFIIFMNRAFLTRALWKFPQSHSSSLSFVCKMGLKACDIELSSNIDPTISIFLHASRVEFVAHFWSAIHAIVSPFNPKCSISTP